MDTWLKYHVALLFCSLAPVLRAAGVDNYRLARTRDLLVLAIRGVREAFRVLQAMGLPVTPSKFRLFQWLPEPILILFLQRLLANPLMETALVKHAEAARDEVQHLIGEFMALARSTSVPTPTIDRLLRFYEPDAPVVPEGSAEIPLHWGGVLALLAGLVTLLTAGGLSLGRLIRRKGA
jgi:2-dehydropantoate 2-reductase